MAYTTDTVVLHVADPQGDDVQPKFRAPQTGGEKAIVAAHAIVDTALVEGATNRFSLRLLKYTMSGTALTLSGTVSGILGGTNAGGTAPGWVANQPYPFVITDGVLDSGEWLTVDYDEAGTVAPLNIDIVLELGNGPRTIG
jgi:hypothetical protein